MRLRMDNPKKSVSARRRRPSVVEVRGRQYKRSDGSVVTRTFPPYWNWRGEPVRTLGKR